MSSTLNKRLHFIRNNYLKLQFQFVNRQESNYNFKCNNKTSNTTLKLIKFRIKIYNYNNNLKRDSNSYKLLHRIQTKQKH